MFIEEYLHDLRRQRFSPAAVAEYLRRLAARMRGDLDANPGAVRSVWGLGLGFFVLAFAAAAGLALGHDLRLASELFVGTTLWILVTFIVLTLHLGGLRDGDGYRLSAINLPIALTLLRLALVPGLALFLLERQFVVALALFALATATDVADGWVARRWRQVTVFGTVLDPLVDIVFNLAVFVALGLAGVVAAWVAAVAVLRYALLLVGGAALYVLAGPVRIRPTLFGRLTGVVMTAQVLLIVVLHVAGGPLHERLGPLAEIALGALLSATVLQVVLLGWDNLRRLRGASVAPGKVVGDVRWGAE